MFDTFSDLNINETVKSIFHFIDEPILEKRRFYAHDKLINWIFYEHLYTDIDKVLFQGKNDFQRLLKSSFPSLKTEKLTKGQWQVIRRIIGRPRRMSDTFLTQERRILNEKRFKMVNLQSIYLETQPFDISIIGFIEAAESILNNTSIPHILLRETPVLVKFASPLNGLYEGIVKGPNDEPGFYNVELKRVIVVGTTTKRTPLAKIVPGTYKIQECFIYRMENSDISYFTLRQLKDSFVETADNQFKINHPNISKAEEVYEIDKNDEIERDFFQKTNLFLFMVKLDKALKEKKKVVSLIKGMNDFIEEKSLILSDSLPSPIDSNFQRDYASQVIQLSDINADVKSFLLEISNIIEQSYHSIYKKQVSSVIDWRRKSTDEAIEIVDQVKSKKIILKVDDVKTKFIIRLTSLITILSNVSDCQDTNEFMSIEDLLEEVKNSIDRSNQKVYETNVVAHVRHILNTICPEWETIKVQRQNRVLTPNQMYYNRQMVDQNRYVFPKKTDQTF